MPRRTNPFQKLSALIMSVFYEPDYFVDESVLEKNLRTGLVREIDIRISSRNDSKDRMLLECRAHKRKQDVQWIDAIDGKARSLGFKKVVAISSSGFTGGAIAEARDRCIETLYLREAEEADWRKWKTGINEFGLQLEGPVLRSVEFGIDADWSGVIPAESIPLNRVILMDTRDGTKIYLIKWIEGLLNDPEQAAEIQSLARKGNISDLVKTHRCSPEMGFVLEGKEETFIPLVELKVHIDYAFSRDSIPVRHLDVGGQRVLFGEAQVRGALTRVVIYEKTDALRLLIEREQQKREK